MTSLEFSAEFCAIKPSDSLIIDRQIIRKIFQCFTLKINYVVNTDIDFSNFYPLRKEDGHYEAWVYEIIKYFCHNSGNGRRNMKQTYSQRTMLYINIMAENKNITCE